MIRAEDVADLREGDIVRVTGWQGLTVEGPLSTSLATETLWLGNNLRLTWDSTHRPDWMDKPGATLIVVSRAPRPLYVNHPRTEAVVDDIVNYGVGYNGRAIGPFMYTATERWAGSPQDGRMTRWVGLPGGHPDTGPIYNAGQLRLLVDGTTGQALP